MWNILQKLLNYRAKNIFLSTVSIHLLEARRFVTGCLKEKGEVKDLIINCLLLLQSCWTDCWLLADKKIKKVLFSHSKLGMLCSDW